MHSGRWLTALPSGFLGNRSGRLQIDIVIQFEVRTLVPLDWHSSSPRVALRYSRSESMQILHVGVAWVLHVHIYMICSNWMSTIVMHVMPILFKNGHYSTYIVHIFKAARLGVTVQRAHSSVPSPSLFAMSAQLDNTLVWITFDNP